jgi:ATP-binding cassette subfamily F protein uup
MLSGGERNRLLLARLFARPANVLVLDEPTNDLDIESLELLESTLQDYPGTVLLVSHDRRFLDEVVTQTLAAEGDGAWREYVGGYSEWLEQRPASRPSRQASADDRAPAPGRTEPDRASQVRPVAKLSYKETRELERLPVRIEELETEQQSLTTRMGASDYHAQGPDRIRADRLRSQAIEHELEAAFARWAELEARVTALRQG